MEDELLKTQGMIQQHSKIHKSVKQKIEDLEKQSRHNMQITGLPESYKVSSLLDICSVHIPEALSMKQPCMAEKAHRLGAPLDNQKTPRPMIMKYLNCVAKLAILLHLRHARSLAVDSQNILLFADYSQEMSQR